MMDFAAPISSWAHPTPQEIQSARAQLAALEATLLSRLAEIDAIRNRIAHLKKFTAPIRRVPPEILGRFITLSATAPDAPIQVLRTLSSVCKYWRDTTLHTPEAWSKIHFCDRTNEPLHGPRTWLRTLGNVEEWFRNSGKSKKEVRASIVRLDRDDRRALMQLIAAHSDTLRVLAIDNAELDDANMLIANPMPFLEEWAVYTPTSEAPFPPWQLAPRLRRLALDQNLRRLSATQRARTTQLELLPIQSSDRSLLTGLSLDGGFSSLRVLDVFDVSKISRVSMDIQLTLPELEVLRMDLVIKSRMTHLFSQLKLPKLTTLVLHNAYGLEDSVGLSNSQVDEMALLLRTLIDTSHPPLRRLFLDAFAIGELSLIAALKLLPLLERLVLTDMPLTDTFASRLIGPQDRSTPIWVCPRLTHMDMTPHRDTIPEFSFASVERLIDARAAEAERTGGAVARLQRVRINAAEMVQANGTLTWVTNRTGDSIEHPDIFCGAYCPTERWWRVEHHIIGEYDALGL